MSVGEVSVLTICNDTRSSQVYSVHTFRDQRPFLSMVFCGVQCLNACHVVFLTKEDKTMKLEKYGFLLNIKQLVKLTVTPRIDPCYR